MEEALDVTKISRDKVTESTAHYGAGGNDFICENGILSSITGKQV